MKRLIKINKIYLLCCFLVFLCLTVVLFCSCKKNNIKTEVKIFTINYLSTEGGYISGEANQSVKENENATEITALPYEGYIFKSWSDGNANATRIEGSVSKDLTFTAIFEKLTFAVKYLTDGNGTIAGNTEQTIEYGEQATSVTVTANEGYKFVKWSDGVTKETRTDTVKTDLTVTAIFEKQKYAVKYKTDGNGRIDGPTEQTVAYKEGGSEVTAIPNEGYKFVRWDDGKETSNRVESGVTCDKTHTAIFEKITYALKYATDGNGRIDGQTEQTVAYKESGSEVTAIPNEGYKFVRWDDGKETSGRAEREVTSDKIYTAIFEKITYTLKYATDGNGRIEGQKEQTIAYKESGSEVTAIPNEGYKFVRWDDGKETSNRVESEVTSDKTHTAIFEKITYTLKYATDGNGRIDGQTEQTVAYKESGSEVTAIPDEGYKFVRWDDGKETSGRAEREVTSDKTHTAIFEKITYTLKYATDGNGRIDGQTEQTVSYKESGSEVTAIPNEGYKFVRWDDGKETSNRVESEVTSDKTHTAIFEKITYTLKYVTGNGGYIIGEDSQTVSYGNSGAKVTAIPNEGYKFIKWSDGVTRDTRQDLNIISNLEVYAEFEFLFAGIGINNSFLIETYEQLCNMYYYPSANYELANDLDLNEINHEPIFDANTWFDGRFNGGNHTIMNLSVETEKNYPSLFGIVINGFISNLKIENANIVTYNYNTEKGLDKYNVGIVAGMAVGYIHDIEVSGKITSNGFDYNYVSIGGLIGMASGTIANCSVNVNIEVSNANSANDVDPFCFGGLIGVSDSAWIRECSTEGNIVVIESCRYTLAGGLVGYYYTKQEIDRYIIDCSTNMSLSCANTGGLIGKIEINSNVKFNIGNCKTCVSITQSGNVGGLIYWINSSGKLKIDNCHTINEISESLRAAGFIYYTHAYNLGTCIITNCDAKGNISYKKNTDGIPINVAVGFCYDTSKVDFKYCYSECNLFGRVALGFGYMTYRSLIECCFTVGDVYGSSFVSGFLNSSGDIKMSNSYSQCNIYYVNCENKPRINRVAGLVCYTRNSVLENCYYSGNIVIQSNLLELEFGEIVGYLAGYVIATQVINCHVLNSNEFFDIPDIGTINDNCQAEIIQYKNIADMYNLSAMLNNGVEVETWIDVENGCPELKLEK